MGCASYDIRVSCNRCGDRVDAVDPTHGLCKACLQRDLFSHAYKVPEAYTPVPETPTEEQALEVFTFCGETVLLLKQLDHVTNHHFSDM